MKFKPLPPQSYVLDLLDYSVVTGQLFWRQDSNPNWPRWWHNAGNVAGKPGTDGYLFVYFDNFGWRAHRLIWLLVTGQDPGVDEIDHADGDGANNKWINLRQVTRSQQLANRRRPRNNKSGVKGVHQRADGKWVAIITMNGKGRWLGAYATFEEAVAVRLAAETEVHGAYSAMGRGNVTV